MASHTVRMKLIYNAPSSTMTRGIWLVITSPSIFKVLCYLVPFTVVVPSVAFRSYTTAGDTVGPFNGAPVSVELQTTMTITVKMKKSLIYAEGRYSDKFQQI
ncbi:hypothetical protein ASPWEDRAFT_22328 [Aspergillus wentii DTO 134E9]|uniref:Uncharacterized protein n=1 Tax=Aspergillus wentii DTO 134E9 TaxID=1073089 RepID=A0A1L9RYS9_ASPWE|nr:uncharacterized protein ASPWEDRAFT_22328 [Aspergillus wentii DTO 134E9]OJJ40120.1 hypothetical protein ASPWEDRAFT_22328 [Aspergillus wentii DTO 134E9]